MAFDNPHGFIPVKYDRAQVLWYDVSTHATDVTAAVDNIYLGDVVINSSNAGGKVVAMDTSPDATDMFVGVSMGIADGGSSDTNLQKVAVCVDPNAVYRVQSNSSTLPIQSEMWEAFTITVPTTYTGGGSLSDMELIGDNSLTHPDGQWVLVGIVTGPQPGGGVLPTWGSANVELYVRPNIVQMLSWEV